MFKVGTKLVMNVGGSTSLSCFEAGEGAFFTVGGHKINFSANAGNPITNFTAVASGHFEFDYHGRHYSHDAAPNTSVTLGDTASFTDF